MERLEVYGLPRLLPLDFFNTIGQKRTYYTPATACLITNVLHGHGPAPYGKAPFNVFQRIDDGDTLWRAAIGVGYEDWLTSVELQTLKILYQKRHLLAHCEGIVDQKYVEKSRDATYKPGQRLVIAGDDVATMLSLLEKLGARLQDAARP